MLLSHGDCVESIELEKRREAEKLEREKRRAWAGYIKQRGERYRDCRLENFKVTSDAQKSVVDRIEHFCQSANLVRSNLIMVGPTGTGKDHLLTHCVRSAVRCGVTDVNWTSGPQLFSSLRQAIARKESDSKPVQPLYACDLLVISDLAMSPLTDYQREIVYQIVDRRYNNRKPTWVSANAIDRESFEAATSPQIVDRLTHGAVYLACNWDSYRKR